MSDAFDWHGEPFRFSVETRLRADAATVWAHATTIEGVNRELAPLARMTAPAGLVLDREHVTLGQRIFRSHVLAFGLIPVDYDDITLVELEEPRRFLERSPMMSQRMWEHERVVEPAPGGSTLRDTVRFEPRVRWLGHLQLPVFRLVFRNRHRQLARIFGRA